ncbi:MAG: hypothetical protein HQK84_11320 [Nitrospinae bacterium]|nr:hypothetical protein [Nitrospinota bacterium]
MKQELTDEITKNIVNTLKVSFPEQLGFTDESESETAQNVVSQFAPGWVWVYLQEFKPIIAGMSSDNYFSFSTTIIIPVILSH